VQAVNDFKPTRRPRFVAMTGKDTYRLDLAAIERARGLAGLKGYVTNLPAPIMPAQELIDHYHDLWHVEQSFRIPKPDLQASPFFARKQDAIEAHLTIVFAALAIARTIQHRSGLPIRHVIRVLRPLRSATIHANGITQTIPPITDPDQQALINTLTTTPPRH
jgi:transposase